MLQSGNAMVEPYELAKQCMTHSDSLYNVLHLHYLLLHVHFLHAKGSLLAGHFSKGTVPFGGSNCPLGQP